MKKIHTAVASLLVGTLLLSACKETFLDEKPLSVYTPQATLTDSLSFEAAIAGLQAVVRQQYSAGEPQSLLATMQLGTDITTVGQIQGVERPYYDYTQMNSQDQGAAYFWTWAYQAINNANTVIQYANAPTAIMGQGNKDRISAEARFYRAYAYNFLVTLFGAVPLIDQPIVEPRTDFTRASVEDLNKFILADLTFAVANLVDIDKVVKSGRMSNAAAKQLLAEFYLRTNQPALAEQQCQDIIASGKFKLVTSRYGTKSTLPGDPFSDMFVYGNQRRNQGNTESIWVIENEFNVIGGSYTAPQQRRVWVPFYAGVKGMKVADSLGGRGIGRIRLNNWVNYSLYPKGDIRNSEYNIKRNFYYNDPAQPATFGKKVTGLVGSDTLWRITPYTTKWNHYIPTDEFGYATIKDFIMMRLGETYLLLAEAQVKQSKLAAAAASINALRTRAKAPLVTESDMTLNFVLDERVRELIGEEQRRLTLVRTGTLVERALRLNGAAITGLKASNMLLPIPQSEIDVNKNGTLTQNPGY